jgi:hypothetical protein
VPPARRRLLAGGNQRHRRTFAHAP